MCAHTAFTGRFARTRRRQQRQPRSNSLKPSNHELVKILCRAYSARSRASRRARTRWEWAGMSRIYGGIHFMTVNCDGNAAGAVIGRHVLKDYLLRASTKKARGYECMDILAHCVPSKPQSIWLVAS